MPGMAETLTAAVERVTFHSPETGYAVLRAIPRGKRGLTDRHHLGMSGRVNRFDR